MTTPAIQSLLDTLPVFAAILDHQGRVLAVNSLMRESFPTDLNQDFSEVFFWDLPWFKNDPETRDVLKQRVASCLNGSSENLDLRYERAYDGDIQTGWIELSLKPKNPTSQSDNAITATAVDRTHREALREEVAASQKAVELERAKLELMFNQVAIPITMLEGPEHLYTYQNKSHRDLFYGGRSVVGLTVAQASPEAVDQGFIQLLNQVYKTGGRFTGVEFPLTMHRENDSHRDFFVNLTFEPSRNGKGEIVGILGSAVDVTPQVQARANMRETESYFQELVNASPAMIWMTDADSRCVYLSQRWYEFTGRTPEQDLGLGWLENIHPEDLPETARVYAHAVSNKGPLKVDYRLRDFKGNYHWTIDLGFPRFDTNGVFLGYIGTVTDIHERIAAQNELKRIQTRFERSAKATGLGIWYCDLPFDELMWNTQVKSHFWLPPDARVTIDLFYERIHPEDREPTRLAIEKSIEHKRHYDITYRTVNPANASEIKYVRAVGWTDYDGQGNPRRFDGLTLDMSADKKFQEELQDSKIAAETANKAKSDFLANMSHEIRTPLGAILGFTELISDPNLDAKEREHYVATIRRNGTALTRIIDDILDLAKVESGKLEIENIDFSFVELLQDSLELFREKAKEKGLYLNLSLAPNVPKTISSDPTRLRQIILNLIGNAVKFTQVGGVTVDVSAMSASGNEARVCIRIEDTGVGIEPEKRDRLFQPFAQADTSTTRKFGGTGLGLVVSNRLAHALGGEIRLEQPDEPAGAHQPGSVFAFTFNAALNFADSETPSTVQTKQAPRASTVLDPAQDSLAGLRILLADDSADNRLLITRLLAKVGANVDTAVNGLEACKMAMRTSYDAVLMDIQMPEMDGYEATRALREKQISIPIIALTAHAMAEDHARSLQAGCSAHITKPINRLDLISTIVRFVNRP